MKIGILKETQKGENRVSVSPTVAKQFADKGFEVFIEKDAGEASSFKNSDYQEAGVKVESREDIYKKATILIKINPFTEEDLKLVEKHHILMSQLFHKSNPKLMENIANTGATAFSMDAMPRISRAQDMDVLSSQNNLAGYKSVIVGANKMTKIFPLMMTAAGTVTPARVLIFGVGVAGLQAIATAKRLGAVVEATDIRMETKEQTESLGAKFITVDNTGEQASEGGYAKEASEEYAKKQKEAVNASLFKADLVITTAMVPGKKAPVLISKKQTEQMKNGAVIIDLAATQGGNVEGSVENKEIITENGVRIFGYTMSPVSVATNASELFGKNMYNFIMHLTNEEKNMNWDLEEEITNDTLIVKDGKIRNN